MKINLTVIVFVFLSILIRPFPAQSMSVPQMGKKEEGSFVAYYKEGGKRWEANWTTEEFKENGETKVKTILNAKGLTSPFAKDMRWKSVSVWKESDGRFTPIESETTFKDTEGNVVMTEKTSVDEEIGNVAFTRKDYEGDGSLTEKFETSPDLLIVEGMVIALRSLPFKTKETVKTEFLTNEPELYNIEFKQKGVETIATPEGEIECYKVELVPKLGMLNVFKAFFPKTYFWFTKAPPHSWVRYEGLENGRDTPQVVMEVTRFEQTGN